jgi:regulator of replication initiation timing
VKRIEELSRENGELASENDHLRASLRVLTEQVIGGEQVKGYFINNDED